MKSSEILDLAMLKPTQFQPKFPYHFVLKIDQIDSFLIKSVERSPLVAPDFQSKNLTVCMHDVIAPSTQQQIREQITECLKSSANTINITLKELDPVGVVVSKTSWSGCRITMVELPKLDYAKSNTINEIIVHFDLGQENFES